jgi:hypothetical protein
VSSEALERARTIRAALMVDGYGSPPRHTVMGQEALAATDALLAEVARLEQEPVELRRAWRANVEELTRQYGAALAVAREREQRCTRGLNLAIVSLELAIKVHAAIVMDTPGDTALQAKVLETMRLGLDAARAALEEEPAAAETAGEMEARAAALDIYGESLPDGVTTEAFAEASNLRREARRLRASAAADEPPPEVAALLRDDRPPEAVFDAFRKLHGTTLGEPVPNPGCRSTGSPSAAADEPGETP